MAPVEIRSHAGLSVSVCLIVCAQLCDFTKCSPLFSDMSLSPARTELELYTRGVGGIFHFLVFKLTVVRGNLKCVCFFICFVLLH